MKIDLNILAMNIFKVCLEHNMTLEVEWDPRTNANLQLDFLSKEIADPDDWEIADCIFQIAANRWGNFSCDAFANHKNNKVKTFLSKRWCPGTSGINALSCDLT